MRTGFIGAGNMGGAIIRGYLASGKESSGNIFVYDQDESRQKALIREYGVFGACSIPELVRSSDIIVLAVKPGIFDQLLPQLAEALNQEEAASPAAGGGRVSQPRIVVSIAAGITIRYIASFLGGDRKIIRAMPNTPAMVGEGMAALSRNEQVDEREFATVRNIFRTVGRAEEVDERLMDTVTGVSGSGPAYVYMFIEAMIEGAVRNGMKEKEARLFAAQTVYGAAKMVLDSSHDPRTLRENVCSPGGTTVEAVHRLQENGFVTDILEGMQAAVEKSRQLKR